MMLRVRIRAWLFSHRVFNASLLILTIFFVLFFCSDCSPWLSFRGRESVSPLLTTY